MLCQWYQDIAYTFLYVTTTHSYLKVIRGLVNSQASGGLEMHFRSVISKLILSIIAWGISLEIAFRWRLFDLADDKIALVQVMVWCRQETASVDSDRYRHIASLNHKYMMTSSNE